VDAPFARDAAGGPWASCWSSTGRPSPPGASKSAASSSTGRGGDPRSSRGAGFHRTKVLRLERLRLGNEIPMMLETRHIRLDLCPASSTKT